jgi:hypothetical protein
LLPLFVGVPFRLIDWVSLGVLGTLLKSTDDLTLGLALKLLLSFSGPRENILCDCLID